MKSDQKGFTLIEVLLIILIISVLGGIGYYVYSHNQDNSQQSESDITSTKENNVKQETKSDETLGWQEIESSKKAFKMRVPDGWKLNNSPDGDSFIVKQPAELTYKKGQAAKITRVMIAASDAPTPFYIAVEDHEKDIPPNLETTGFVLNNGLKGKKLVEESKGSQTETTAWFYGVDNAKLTYYLFEKDGKFYHARYLILSEQPNNTEIVEKAIKTLQF